MALPIFQSVKQISQNTAHNLSKLQAKNRKLSKVMQTLRSTPNTIMEISAHFFKQKKCFLWVKWIVTYCFGIRVVSVIQYQLKVWTLTQAVAQGFAGTSGGLGCPLPLVLWCSGAHALWGLRLGLPLPCAGVGMRMLLGCMASVLHCSWVQWAVQVFWVLSVSVF